MSITNYTGNFCLMSLIAAIVDDLLLIISLLSDHFQWLQGKWIFPL